MLGVSIGTVFTTIAIPIRASVKNVDDAGHTAGMLIIFCIFGAVIGLATSSAVFSNVFQQHITALTPLPESLSYLKDGSQAISFIPYLRILDIEDVAVNTLINVYSKAFRAIWTVMACLSGIGLLSSFFMDLDLEILIENLHAHHHQLYRPKAYGASFNALAETLILETAGAFITSRITGLTCRETILSFTFSTLKVATIILDTISHGILLVYGDGSLAQMFYTRVSVIKPGE